MIASGANVASSLMKSSETQGEEVSSTSTSAAPAATLLRTIAASVAAIKDHVDFACPIADARSAESVATTILYIRVFSIRVLRNITIFTVRPSISRGRIACLLTYSDVRRRCIM